MMKSSSDPIGAQKQKKTRDLDEDTVDSELLKSPNGGRQTIILSTIENDCQSNTKTLYRINEVTSHEDSTLHNAIDEESYTTDFGNIAGKNGFIGKSSTESITGEQRKYRMHYLDPKSNNLS